jgi:hypothetical protein
MLGLPRPSSQHGFAEFGGEIPLPQRSVSVRYSVKGLVRDDNKGQKVEFAVLLISYSNLSTGESEPRVQRKEEENLIVVCLADCASYLDSLLHATHWSALRHHNRAEIHHSLMIFHRLPFRSVAIGILIVHFPYLL